MKDELEQLYSHIDDIQVAMMTTRRTDGHLQSRAMAKQKRADGADLWFVSLEETEKLRDLAADPHVNLSYYKDRTREWISVSGLARSHARPREDPRALRAGLERVVSDRKAIRATPRKTIRAWCSSALTSTRRCFSR